MNQITQKTQDIGEHQFYIHNYYASIYFAQRESQTHAHA